MSVQISITVNGKAVTASVDPRTLLVQFIRENLELTGTHVGCDTAQCGACTVHLNGSPVRSCSIPASAVAGQKITTVEGLANGAVLSALQQAWIDHDVAQCGYCQAGQLMTATALLKQHPNPTDAQIDQVMTNFCRCGTYVRIRKAIHAAAAAGKGGAA